MRRCGSKKVLGALVLILGIVCVRLSFAEYRYGYGYEPPIKDIENGYCLERIAVDYTVGLIRNFGGGDAVVLPPNSEEKRPDYAIKIRTQPKGGPLDEIRISRIAGEVLNALPVLRTVAAEGGVSLEDEIKDFVDGWLEKRYPAFMEEVRKQEQAYRAKFEDALNTLLGISDKSQLSKGCSK